MRRIALSQSAYLRSALPVAIALAMSLAMSGAACGGSASGATDGPDPIAAPTPFEVADTVIATPSPEEIMFDPVVSELGYALVPQQLPDGFELGTVEILMFPSNPTGRLIYAESADSKFELHISYQMIFPPTGGSLFEHAGFGIPEDALIEVPLSGDNGAAGTGFLIRGGWDPETLRLELPTEARWDYERSLTVMIAYEMGSMEPVWVAVRAEHLPGQWISVAELISIAESIDKVR